MQDGWRTQLPLPRCYIDFAVIIHLKHRLKFLNIDRNVSQQYSNDVFVVFFFSFCQLILSINDAICELPCDLELVLAVLTSHHGNISVQKLPQICTEHIVKWGKSGVGIKR